MGKWTLPKLKKRLDAKDMTLEEAAYIAGELLQESAQIEVDLVTARELVRMACTTGEDGSPVKYGEFDGDGNYILPKELPNIPSLEASLETANIAGKLLTEATVDAVGKLLEEKRKVEAQLTTEEECAMNSGGILSDVCDLVFDDPERAATHGYEGVKEKIVEMKNQLRLYQIQIDKL